MRHLNKGRKLNRTASHRQALLSNLASALITYKRIVTTEPKAKELRRFAERLVTYAKKDELHGRRLILKSIKGKANKKIANILIHEVAPNYINRNGGYTRIIKLENRKNDNAKRCLIEFVDIKVEEKTEKSKKTDDTKHEKKDE